VRDRIRRGVDPAVGDGDQDVEDTGPHHVDRDQLAQQRRMHEKRPEAEEHQDDPGAAVEELGVKDLTGHAVSPVVGRAAGRPPK
jgi:hypothetical protein